MNTSPIIRKATPADYPVLLKIGHNFFEFNIYRKFTVIDEVSLLRTFHQLSSEHLLLVITVDEKVVGTAGAFIAPLYWNHNYLQGLEAFWWIEPEYRNTNLGNQLRLCLQADAEIKGVRFWNMIALKESMHDKVCQHYERAGMTHIETVYMKVL
jgi:L-amino acid N-acyltransferase YncA